MTLRLAVVGLGYWGPKIVETIEQTEGVTLAALVDARDGGSYRDLRSVPLDLYDAVCICTPSPTHPVLALQAIDRGKHVWVEKPLALSASEALEVHRAAEAVDVRLLVDHQMLYSPVIRHWRRMLADGSFGKVTFGDAYRTNLGIVRETESPLWSLGPHDIAVFTALFGIPDEVDARAYWILGNRQPDVVEARMQYGRYMSFSFRWSWFDLDRQRTLRIFGADRVGVWKEETYHQYVLSQVNDVRPRATWEDVGSWQPVEPVTAAMEDFRDSIVSGSQPLSSGKLGVMVVGVLEAMEAKIERSAVLGY